MSDNGIIEVDGKQYKSDGFGGAYRIDSNNPKVNICGIPHEILYVENTFDVSSNFGQIDYGKAEIRINKDITPENQKETLCHEIVHGMLTHLGYLDLAGDETLVQALGNAISQSFNVKEV